MATDFDNYKTIKLLNAIDGEIEQKCLELREKKKAAALKRVFFLGCVLAAGIPVLSVFIGFSILVTLIPIFTFQVISLVLLMPLIISSNGGVNHAERAG